MPKDLLVIDDIINILKQRFLPEASVESILTVKECHTVAGLMETIISADVIIATRFHGVVLSLLAEKPVMGICYHQKTEALLKDSGQGDYAVDLDSFDVELLHEKYQKLSRNLSQETYKIYKRRKEIVPALQQQYSSLINIAKESKKWKKDN
jgi:polysaccharide pyruvyl transferase WcaK-like protein